MYIRKSTRTVKGIKYINYILVESVRTPSGPRQKSVCSLGDLSPRPKEDWLRLARKIEDALVGQESFIKADDPEVDEIVRKVKDRQKQESRKYKDSHISTRADSNSKEDDLIAVHADRVRTEEHREAGPVHVGLEFWKRLEIDRILLDVGLDERCRTLTSAMALARLIDPCSEHAMPNWIRTTAMADLLGVDFDGLSHHSLYRNMDKLYEKRAEIESKLVERERDLFHLDTTIFFYDLTSTYFEGQAMANPKAKRGYSRDQRPDCKQVVVGLVVNRDGFPQAHEVFEGNLQDRKSLGAMLDLLNARVGLKAGQTVVVDRGMAYAENLEEIRARGLHYLVASRQSERDQWLSKYEEAEGFEPVLRETSPQNPCQKKSRVEVKRMRQGEETHVLCVSEGRTEKDRAIREKQEGRLLKDMEKLSKRIEEGRLSDVGKIGEAIGRLKERYPRVARYYYIAYDAETKRLKYSENKEKKNTAEKLDGGYLLKTDRDDLDAEEAWRIYILLTRAEHAFRDMKSPLAERPVFHHIERRVDTHIFLCVLAYHLLVSIEKTLLDQGVHTSWGTVKETLKTHQVCTVVLPTDDGSVLRIRKGSTPEEPHKELYGLLKVPMEVMKPKKTWKPAELEM